MASNVATSVKVTNAQTFDSAIPILEHSKTQTVWKILCNCKTWKPSEKFITEDSVRDSVSTEGKTESRGPGCAEISSSQDEVLTRWEWFSGPRGGKRGAGIRGYVCTYTKHLWRPYENLEQLNSTRGSQEEFTGWNKDLFCSAFDIFLNFALLVFFTPSNKENYNSELKLKTFISAL